MKYLKLFEGASEIATLEKMIGSFVKNLFKKEGVIVELDFEGSTDEGIEMGVKISKQQEILDYTSKFKHTVKENSLGAIQQYLIGPEPEFIATLEDQFGDFIISIEYTGEGPFSDWDDWGDQTFFYEINVKPDRMRDLKSGLWDAKIKGK